MVSRRRVVLVPPVVVALAAAGSLSTPAVAGQARVCAGIAGCRVVARVDVDGDGHRDTVALVRRGGGEGRRGSVTVRVAVSADRVVRLRLPLDNWTGPVWQGAAALDARPGQDLLVGRQMGASAQFYQSVTWRHGRLVPLDAPGPSRWWSVGRSATVIGGWLRHASDPAGVIRWRVATAAAPGTYLGQVTTYRWRAGAWHQLRVRVVAPLSPARAARWGGFHVPGLARW